MKRAIAALAALALQALTPAAAETTLLTGPPAAGAGTGAGGTRCGRTSPAWELTDERTVLNRPAEAGILPRSVTERATDMATRLFSTRIDLPAERREKLTELLNRQLYDLIDLYGQTKHAHWNVRGRNFLTYHKLFDKVFTDLFVRCEPYGRRDPVHMIAIIRKRVVSASIWWCLTGQTCSGANGGETEWRACRPKTHFRKSA